MKIYQNFFLLMSLLIVIVPATIRAARIQPPSWPLRSKTVEIAPNVHKAYLEDSKGKPFFYNADTCWFLTFKATDDDILKYFENRSVKGITVVQCMILPWVREGDDNWFGIYPFEDQKFDQINEKYFEHVDFVVEAARYYNIALCMSLVWGGCCGEGWNPVLNSDYNKQNDYEPLKKYARFIGRRYRNAGNVMIFLGGDTSENRMQYTKMGKALKKITPEMLIAHHPSSWYGSSETYGIKSSTSKDEHAHGDYLDISWTYTYWPGQNNRAHSHPYYLNHLEWNRNQNVPTETSKVRPFVLGEAGYENERGSKMRRIRRLMHWNIICGSSGHAFGNGSIWGLKSDWKKQLDSPGSIALGHMFDIYAGRDWWRLIPEQPREKFFIGKPLIIAGAKTFIISGQELYDNILSLNEERGQKFVAAARTPDGRLIMAYFPHFYGKSGIEIDMTCLAGPATGKWIDPQNAREIVIAGSPFSNTGTVIFAPPDLNSYGDRDWILVLEVN